jgi:hypothetical protein
MKEYYDLIMLVIANQTNDNCYNDFINEYWSKFIKYVNNNKSNLKIFLLFGEKPIDINIDDSNILITNTKECLIPGILHKTINAFEYCNNTYNYKHILRTNLSSFFILDKLLEMNYNLSDKGVYAGLEFKWGIGGSEIWLSNDVITYIVLNKNKLNYNKIDDVSIGMLLRNKFNKLNIDLYNPFYMLNKEKSDKLIENRTIIFKEVIDNNYHLIRLKQQHGDRTNDIKMVKYLWNFFYDNSKEI